MAQLRNYIGQKAILVYIYQAWEKSDLEGEYRDKGYFLDISLATLEPHDRLETGIGFQFSDGEIFTTFNESIKLVNKTEVLARAKKDLLNKLKRIEKLEREK